MSLKVYKTEKMGTNEKHLLTLGDNSLIEIGIFMHHSSVHLCLSTLVGCPIECKHCATTYSSLKYFRKLSAQELCDEVRYGIETAIRNYSNSPIILSFSGHGEPFLNLEALLCAIDFAKQFNIHDTYVTTVGLKLPCVLPPELALVKLFISLHGTNDYERNLLIPATSATGTIDDVIEITKLHQSSGGRVVWNYMLTKNNTHTDSAKRLNSLVAELLMPVEIRITSFMDIGYETNVKQAEKSKVVSFLEALSEQPNAGIKYTYRLSELEGSDLGIACGQLRALML